MNQSDQNEILVRPTKMENKEKRTTMKACKAQARKRLTHWNCSKGGLSCKKVVVNIGT